MSFFNSNYSGKGITNSQVVTEEGKYAIDAAQNNPDIDGSLRNETGKLNEKINIINSKGNLLSRLLPIGNNSISFTINFSGIGTYRYPIIIYVAGQDVYRATMYGTIRTNSSVVFSDNDAVSEIVTTNISDTEIKVNITFKGNNLWGKALILTWGGGINISD